MTAHSKNETSTFGRLIVAVALLLVFIIATRTPADADLWWHLRAGDEMAQRGEILLEDVFSYTRAGETWVNAFWLADILLYLVYKLGGYFALGGFVAFMAAATLAIVNSRMKGNASLRASILILAATAFAPIWTPRPQLFSFLLLALLDRWLYSLKDKNRQDAKSFFAPPGNLWLLIPFFALWANLHGGYIWGILLLIAELVGGIFDRWFSSEEAQLSGKTLKKLSGFTLLAVLAVLLNPNGIALWKLPFHTVDVSLAVIQEWLSPDFHQFHLHPMLWMLFLLIAGLGLSREPIRYGDLFKVLGFAYMTFVSQRNIAPFAIIAAPLIVRHLSLFLDDRQNTPAGMLVRRLSTDSASKQLPLNVARGINILLIFLISLAALGNLYLVTRPAEVDAQYPVDAIRWIDENQPRGALFNSYNWGGYLTWILRDYPVYIDGRADLYGDEIIGEWWQVVRGGESAHQILDARQINLILLEPSWPLLDELPIHGWQLLYQDEKAVVYGR
ncbi:MAG: hypothetical protein B5M51_01625 [Anaerolinea sp. 4484_236]|nr:MAG: hypothetical protein B5M51_01625 [Anaerolinea sp. 4484_236]